MIMKVANGGYTLALLPLNRKKVRLNSAFSSQILSAIVYRSSHFFRKFDIGLRKMQTCPWALDQKQLQTTCQINLFECWEFSIAQEGREKIITNKHEQREYMYLLPYKVTYRASDLLYPFSISAWCAQD